MLKSMTGFGSVSIDNESMNLLIEIKSLNSKGLDISSKVSHALSEKEVELRNHIGKVLERGKVNLLVIYTNKKNTAERAVVNKDLVAQYYKDLKTTAQLLGADEQDLFRLAMMMPDAYTVSPVAAISEEEWQVVYEAFLLALKKCEEFRCMEGEVLLQMMKDYTNKISELLTEVEKFDPQRLITIREKLHQQVKDFISSEHFDANRFEQELIYYVERLDINEEKVRLRSHINYFLETLNEPISNGKKLSFITQEMGREINTIGSKANDAQIQHLVVQMKDELEKIKEQLNNVV
jgi:uncharacterized protein (TIGR00255 family)